MLLRALLIFGFVASSSAPIVSAAGTSQPTVAVYGFNSGAVMPAGATSAETTTATSSGTATATSTGATAAGPAPWWGRNFDPGAALSDLLTVRLTNLGTLSVVDRGHLAAVLKEQHISAEGDVTPATEAQIGRMLGVGYIFMGKIEQFDQSTPEGVAALNHLFSKLAGTTSSTKTILTVSMQVISANTGQVVQSIEDSRTGVANAYNVSGSGMNYGSQDFQSSAMGKLMDSVADDLAKKIDPSKLTAKAGSPITGHVVAIDGDSIVLNIGSDKGATVGMTFSVVKVRLVQDVDTRAMITTEIPHGTIQITSVTEHSSVAKTITGSAKLRDVVRLQ